MWDDWKNAWQQAVENFERELKGADEPGAHSSRRANAMRRDLSAAGNALNRLESDLEQARKDLAAEAEAEATARRRAEMAQRIDDAETVRIAFEYAERHAVRSGILRRKVEVLQDELAMRREELSGMEEQAALEIQEIEAARAAASIQRERQDADFRKLDRESREKAAEARLEELKKRMSE